MAPDPYAQWTALTDSELTIEKVQQGLSAIQDDLLVVAACADRFIDDVEIQRTLLSIAIERTEKAVDRSRNASTFSSTYEIENKLRSGDATETDGDHDALIVHFRTAPYDAELCNLRAMLLHRLDKLNTFVEICKEFPESVGDEADEDTEEWEDDPWADEVIADSSTSKRQSNLAPQTPFAMSTFLTDDLLHSSSRLATLQWFAGLQILFQRHGSFLWPYRLTILESIPEHVHPSKYRDILPVFDTSREIEPAATVYPWRPEEDWSETARVQAALNEIGLLYGSSSGHPSTLMYNSTHPDFLTPGELSVWYRTRAEVIMDATGCVDNALYIIQYGAGQGIPGLGELGEELSLLSRLVYDAPQGPGIPDDWTLSRWRSMEPSTVVQTYLAYSTPESLPKDIIRLVMPYLFVLESRAERVGKADPQLPTRLLYDYILSSPLDMVAPIFEASKPTLPSTDRLIRNDEDIVRLALACLYGSDSLDEWSTMSRIFECLPAWDVATDDDEDNDLADTTVVSLGAFVTPSTARPRYSASDLLVFFNPLPRASLSRVLDLLDVHLESGEVLSRWNVPAPLRWFLQSNSDASEQRAWANRMARRAGGSDYPLHTLDDWEWLLEDMLKLAGKDGTNSSSAFGLLEQEEIILLFLSGLLNSGKFDIARNLSQSKNFTLDPKKFEDICLSCSREFYDNAQSGNYKFGDMKLAYDCLDVPQGTERILREKEFIEATSRISSFNVMARPGVALSPLEIRLTKDRLSLISRVLSSNGDAYKHEGVILDLVNKLGYRDDITAEVKVLAMLADTALQAEDFLRAYKFSERMVNTVVQLRDSSATNILDDKIIEASEVCWVACFQLGRQLEFDDTRKKLLLLGRAVELCPPEKLHEVLAYWRRLEKEDMEIREERLSHVSGADTVSVSRRHVDVAVGNVASSLRARLKDIHMPSPPLLNTPDAAALASRTFRSVAANFPFSVGHRAQSAQSSNSTEDVSAHATRVLSKGIGWLIGADEGV